MGFDIEKKSRKIKNISRLKKPRKFMVDKNLGHTGKVG